MTVTDDQLELIDAEDPTAIPRMREELRELRLDVARLNTEVGDVHTQLRVAVQRRDEERLAKEAAQREARAIEVAHHKDIEIIGSVLIDEAESRDWCDDYDHIIGRMNNRLTVELPMREKSHTVEIIVSYRVEVEVLATSQENAEDQIANASTSTSWSPSLPFVEGDIELVSSYAYSVDVETA